MSELVVVKPPGKENYMKSLLSLDYGIITSLLINSGFKVDQKNLELLKRFYELKKNSKFFGSNLFNKERVLNFLRTGNDFEIEKKLNSIIEFCDLSGYEIFLFSVMHYRDFEFLLPLFKHLKSYDRQRIIIVGGSAVRNHQDALNLIQAPYIDFLVLGNAKGALDNLLKDWEPESVPGIFYKAKGELIKGKINRANIENQPRPYYDTKDLALMKRFTPFSGIYLPYQIGRGCKNNCAFCSYFDRSCYEIKSLEKVIKDLSSLKRDYDVDKFFFVDSNIMNDPDFIENAAENFKDLNIKWGAQGNILKKPKSFFDKLYEGGGIFLDFGLESASDKVLNSIRKPYNSKIASKCIQYCSESDIKVALNLIVGLPSETEEEFIKTKKFLRENSEFIFDINAYKFNLLEGSNMFNNPGEFDLDPEFREERKRPLDRFLSSKSRSYDCSRENKRKLARIKERRIRELVSIKLKDIYLGNLLQENPIQFMKYLYKRLTLEPLEDCPFFIFSD